jgi:hypothetical protein
MALDEYLSHVTETISVSWRVKKASCALPTTGQVFWLPAARDES